MLSLPSFSILDTVLDLLDFDCEHENKRIAKKETNNFIMMHLFFSLHMVFV